MKKKIVAMMLVGVMVVMNNAVAFGAKSTSGNTDTVTNYDPDADHKVYENTLNETSTRNVSVEYNNTITVYSVDIKWGDMGFTANPGEWDPITHKYAGGSDVTWTPKTTSNGNESQNIEVKNHSNADVKVTFAFNDTSSSSLGASFNGTFNDVDTKYSGWTTGTGVLETGENKLPSAAAYVTKALTLKSDAPNKRVSNLTEIGNVTVTITGPVS